MFNLEPIKFFRTSNCRHYKKRVKIHGQKNEQVKNKHLKLVKRITIN